MPADAQDNTEKRETYSCSTESQDFNEAEHRAWDLLATRLGKGLSADVLAAWRIESASHMEAVTEDGRKFLASSFVFIRDNEHELDEATLDRRLAAIVPPPSDNADVTDPELARRAAVQGRSVAEQREHEKEVS